VIILTRAENLQQLNERWYPKQAEKAGEEDDG
jgi:hypothetical protein